MKNAAPRLLLSLVCVFGCAREARPPADAGPESPVPSSPGQENADPAGAWTYESKEHGFSLTLPSAGWRSAEKKRFMVDFWCRTGVGSAMIAGVDSVKKQTREQFEAAVAQFKTDVAKQGDFLRAPAFREGVSRWGCPYVFAAWCEKGPAETQFVYVAAAVVWLGDKGIAVSTLFEGQGRMRSKLFQAAECGDFEKAAETICVSVR